MFDPLEEVKCRRELAIRYLNEAKEFSQLNNWRATVASAQLSVENTAKAIIAIYKVPSWSHDPSDDLRDLVDGFPQELREYVRELVQISSTLAPEHDRTTYGEPSRGILPWDLYTKEDAERSIKLAERAVSIMECVLKWLRVFNKNVPRSSNRTCQ